MSLLTSTSRAIRFLSLLPIRENSVDSLSYSLSPILHEHGNGSQVEQKLVPDNSLLWSSSFWLIQSEVILNLNIFLHPIENLHYHYFFEISSSFASYPLSWWISFKWSSFCWRTCSNTNCWEKYLEGGGGISIFKS